MLAPNIWQLEHGQKLFICQEKPSGFYKMQENAWRPQTLWWSLQHSPDSLAGGDGAGYLFPRTLPAISLLGLGHRAFGSRLSPPPNLQFLCSWNIFPYFNTCTR